MNLTKSIFLSLILASSANAESLENTKQPCEKYIHTVIQVASTVPAWKEAILHNLTIYQGYARSLKANQTKGRSNQELYRTIESSLNRHSNDTLLGYPVGAKITQCVREQIKPQNIETALQKLNQLKQEIL